MKNYKIGNLKPKRFALALALAALASVVSGCGQQAYSEGTSSGGTSGTGSVPITTGTPTINIPPISTPTVTTTATNGSPNYSYHFQMTGSGYAAQVGGGGLTVATDTVLQISITAGDGMQLPNSGFTIGFNCERFSVRVGNVTQTAFVKKSGYTDFMLMYGYMSYDPCASAQTTWTGDFSGALSPGHQTKAIQINGAAYDNCRLNGDVYDGGCGMSNVYSTHPVDGYLNVFTD